MRLLVIDLAHYLMLAPLSRVSTENRLAIACVVEVATAIVAALLLTESTIGK